MAIPLHGPKNKFKKLYNHGHKHQNGLHKQIIATPKLTHIRSNKWYIAIFASCKSTWDTVPYFGINGLSMILCLWSPRHPLSKLLAIQDHTQNLEEQLWMGGRREVSIISHRPLTRSDLKQERSSFRGSVSTFLQLVVWVPVHTRIAVVHDY